MSPFYVVAVVFGFFFYFLFGCARLVHVLVLIVFLISAFNRTISLDGDRITYSSYTAYVPFMYSFVFISHLSVIRFVLSPSINQHPIAFHSLYFSLFVWHCKTIHNNNTLMMIRWLRTTVHPYLSSSLSISFSTNYRAHKRFLLSTKIVSV